MKQLSVQRGSSRKAQRAGHTQAGRSAAGQRSFQYSVPFRRTVPFPWGKGGFAILKRAENESHPRQRLESVPQYMTPDQLQLSLCPHPLLYSWPPAHYTLTLSLQHSRCTLPSLQHSCTLPCTYVHNKLGADL